VRAIRGHVKDVQQGVDRTDSCITRERGRVRGLGSAFVCPMRRSEEPGKRRSTILDVPSPNEVGVLLGGLGRPPLVVMVLGGWSLLITKSRWWRLAVAHGAPWRDMSCPGATSFCPWYGTTQTPYGTLDRVPVLAKRGSARNRSLQGDEVGIESVEYRVERGALAAGLARVPASRAASAPRPVRNPQVRMAWCTFDPDDETHGGLERA
jgi:hypothetical protein